MLRPGVFKQPLSYHYDLYLPEPTTGHTSAQDRAAAPLLVCLHGYGQTKEVALRFGKTVLHGGPVAALQAPHAHHLRRTPSAGVGFSWVSPLNPGEDIANHHTFLRHVIDGAFAEGLTEQREAFLFGFSQSVSLNYRFALAHPDYVAGVVAVARATPSDWVGAEVQLDAPVLHLAPEADEAYPADKTEVFRAVLGACVRDLTWVDVPGGHRVPSAGYPVIRAWLDEKRTSTTTAAQLSTR